MLVFVLVRVRVCVRYEEAYADDWYTELIEDAVEVTHLGIMGIPATIK